MLETIPGATTTSALGQMTEAADLQNGDELAFARGWEITSLAPDAIACQSEGVLNRYCTSLLSRAPSDASSERT